jgi:hypothetical protein
LSSNAQQLRACLLLAVMMAMKTALTWVIFVDRAMGSSGKKFFQMKKFDAGVEEGGWGWLLQAEPAIDMQPW